MYGNLIYELSALFLLFELRVRSSEDSIAAIINAFSKARDQQNTEVLEDLLDDNFRIVMNQLFGSTEVSIMPKSDYLDKKKLRHSAVIKEIP